MPGKAARARRPTGPQHQARHTERDRRGVEPGARPAAAWQYVQCPCLLKGGHHVTLVVLDAAVACQRQAAVQHRAPAAVKAHGVQVVRARVARARRAHSPLGRVRLSRAPRQRVPQPLRRLPGRRASSPLPARPPARPSGCAPRLEARNLQERPTGAATPHRNSTWWDHCCQPCAAGRHAGVVRLVALSPPPRCPPGCSL
jgi:hypothetical protein